MAGQKPTILVIKPYRNFPLGHNRLTCCPLEPQLSLVRILIT
jgi:hypothetical protein